MPPASVKNIFIILKPKYTKKRKVMSCVLTYSLSGPEEVGSRGKTCIGEWKLLMAVNGPLHGEPN